MKKTIRLTENDLTNLIKKIIEEAKSSPSKKKIMDMSQDELNDVYGELEVKGKYLGTKGTFHHFKKVRNEVICSFRADETTPTGLKRNTQAIKVKSDDVKFN
jgi:hypothetical protein